MVRIAPGREETQWRRHDQTDRSVALAISTPHLRLRHLVRIQWTGAPQGTVSFVLMFHDADTLVNNSTDGTLHWLLWNIPGTANGVAQGKPDFQICEMNWKLLGGTTMRPFRERWMFAYIPIYASLLQRPV